MQQTRSRQPLLRYWQPAEADEMVTTDGEAENGSLDEPDMSRGGCLTVDLARHQTIGFDGGRSRAELGALESQQVMKASH